MSSSLSFHKLRIKARELMPFLPPEHISPRGTKDQSALLLKLPPELREMIWKEYFGRPHVVHVSGRKLDATHCLKLNTDDRCPHWFMDGRPRGNHHRCNHVLLLLTCKKIYFECLYILYRETYFDFSHNPFCVKFLSKRLPASHVALISQVNLCFELYHPPYQNKNLKKNDKNDMAWVEIWNALAALEGLKWLRFELIVTEAEIPALARQWTEREWTLWESVKKVTRPKHFELILPFPAAPSTREEELPCTIIRRVNQHPFY